MYRGSCTSNVVIFLLPVEFSATGRFSLDLYFNSALLTSHSDSQTAVEVGVPFDEGCVLAVRVSGDAFLASRRDDIIVTDRTWRCASVVEDGSEWFAEDFDDGHWPAAVEAAPNDGSLHPRVAGVAEEAQWIGTVSTSGDELYCRKDVCLDCDSIANVEERASNLIAPFPRFL